jgi:hypothetical protein
VWQRLAPDPAALQTTRLWAGQRLTATLPVADEPWLSPLLPQMDAYLVRACADWQCPYDLQVPVTFSGRLEELPSLAPPRRPEPGAAGTQPYPVTFDLIFRTPRYPRRVILPSLMLAGRPHDQAAQAALVRSTTVNLLAYVATELAQSSRSGSGDYLDALIARAEIRLGLSPAPAWRPSPAAYLPPEALWPFSRIGETRARRADLAARLQALAFLDFALGDRLPSAEGALLRRIRFHPRLDTWLSDNLSVDGPALVERWAAQTTAAFAVLAPPHWDELEGLAYVCQDGAWLVRGGQPTPLPAAGPRTWLLRHALSADGQYLAVVEATSSTVSQIRVINLSDHSSQVVASAGLGLPLGWTPAGDLLYLTQANGPFSSMFAYELRLYDPRTQLNLALSADPLVTPWDYRPTWSADRTLMAVTLVQNASDDSEALVTAPGVISFKTTLQALRLAAYGYAAAIAPDGRLLAYVDGPLARDGLSGQAGEIKLVSTLTQAVYPLAASGPTDFYDVSALHWSPDSRQLAFQAHAANGRASLYLVTLPDGNPAKAVLQPLDTTTEAVELGGFSADGRYLAAQHYEQSRSETLVFELDTGQSTRYLGGGSTMPWSPRGHLLALAGPGGLYVADLGTGEVQWVRRGLCTPSWFELP